MSILTSPALRWPKSLWSHNPIPSGCVLYLPLWSPALSGPVFQSVDAYRHTCTPTGTTKFWTPHGWDLAGVDESIDLPVDIFSEASFSGGMTLMAWIKLGTVDDTSQMIIDIEGRLSIAVSGTTDEAFMATYDGGNHGVDADDVGALSTGVWYHIVGTWDTTVLRIYVDAVADATTAASNVPLIDPVNRITSLGSTYAGGNFLDGTIGELWVYNRALSVGEIAYIRSRTLWRY